MRSTLPIDCDGDWDQDFEHEELGDLDPETLSELRAIASACERADAKAAKARPTLRIVRSAKSRAHGQQF